MDKMQLVKESAAWFSFEGLRNAVEGAANSPKVAAGVAAGTTSLGAISKMEVIQSTAGTVSLLVGTLTGCVVLAIQLIKLVRVYRSWVPNKPDSAG